MNSHISLSTRFQMQTIVYVQLDASPIFFWETKGYILKPNATHQHFVCVYILSHKHNTKHNISTHIHHIHATHKPLILSIFNKNYAKPKKKKTTKNIKKKYHKKIKIKNENKLQFK